MAMACRLPPRHNPEWGVKCERWQGGRDSEFHARTCLPTLGLLFPSDWSAGLVFQWCPFQSLCK